MFVVQKLNNKINQIIAFLLENDIYNYRLGVARSVLCLGTFLTLISNDTNLLFTAAAAPTGAPVAYDSGSFIFQHLNFFLLPPIDYLPLMQVIAVGILFLVLIGWRPRYTCILHFWICISFNYSTSAIEGGDQIVSNLSFLLIPILLLDSRKWHWQSNAKNAKGIFYEEKKLISNFFHQIIKLQMCLIYLHAAVGKIAKPEWANGTAMYYWLTDPIFGMCDWLKPVFNPLIQNAFGVSLITWGAITLEFLLFMAIVMRWGSKYYLMMLGIFFHFLIVVFHGLFSFFFAMAGGLLLYLWIDNPYGKIKFIEIRQRLIDTW